MIPHAESESHFKLSEAAILLIMFLKAYTRWTTKVRHMNEFGEKSAINLTLKNTYSIILFFGIYIRASQHEALITF